MKTPLRVMTLRTFETDAQNVDKRFTLRLTAKASPLGGDYGRVRSSGTRNHQGWDLTATAGTPVFAITAGTVEWTHTYTGDPEGDPYGNQVCLRTNLTRKATGQPLWAFYAHLMRNSVHTHQVVHEGDVVGFVGNTGNAEKTPSHLHFEIRCIGSRHLMRGLLYRLNPGEVLGYSYHMCA
jgi:murein DD-endopeptidase MepM/ murein hydrolase activator NlpD